MPPGALIDLGNVSMVPSPDGEPAAVRPGFGRRFAMAAVAALTVLVPVASGAPEPLSVRPPVVIEVDGQLAIADDTVYAAPRPTARLRAYDLATGDLRWASQVAVHGQFFVRRVGRVVLVSAPQEGWQTLSLDAATGALLWSHPGIFAAVDRRADEAVFVLPAGPGAGGAFEIGGVSAVDLATGRTRWTYPPRGSRVELVLGVATDGTDQVVAGAIERYGADSELLDFATGGTVPLPPLGDYGALTLVGDLLLVGTAGEMSGPLKAYDRRTMRLRWTALDGQFAGAVDGCGRWLCVSTPAGAVVVDPANGFVRRRMDWSAVRGGGGDDRSLAFELDPASPGGVAVVQMSTGRQVIRVDGWQPLLTSYASRLPLLRGHVDGLVELGVLDVGRGRFYRIGDLRSTAGDPCLASRSYVACSTGAGELRVWRYSD